MERRTHPRYQLDSPAVIETMTAENVRINGKITDVSLGGTGLLLETCIPSGTNITLQTDLFPGKPALSAKANIKWSKSVSENGQFRHGVEFTELNSDLLRDTLNYINIKNTESFFCSPLPSQIRENLANTWIHSKLNQAEIMNVIDFEPPFLKTEKIVVFDTFKNAAITHDRALATGIVTPKDTKGHYNDTMFLALCGWLMASNASIHLAVLAPKTVPQVIEAIGVRPMLSFEHKKHVWKPASGGTRFFVESQIIRQKLRLAIATTTITFGNVLFGVVDELKLIIDSRESIFNALPFPAIN